jgi:hypothetical protein
MTVRAVDGRGCLMGMRKVAGLSVGLLLMMGSLIALMVQQYRVSVMVAL